MTTQERERAIGVSMAFVMFLILTVGLVSVACAIVG